MVNLYKLLNVLEQGMSLFQLNKWKTEGIWYPITQYKKESDEIQVVTNLFIADQEQYHIQLSGNYPEEFDDWNNFLKENQWKIYPLLANIMQVFLPTGNYQVRYIGCVPSICILGFILFWEVIDYILGLCTQKYLEFSGL